MVANDNLLECWHIKQFCKYIYVKLFSLIIAAFQSSR
jgi:hypothetical protein